MSGHARGSRPSRPCLAVVLLACLLTPSLPAFSQSGVAKRIQYGEIVSAEKTVVVDQVTGTGAQVGSTVGAVAGYALADRGDRWIGSLLGGVVGAAAGHAAEKGARKKKGWELIIRLDTGEEVGIDVPSRKETFELGDRVRLQTGGGRTKVSKV